MKWFRFYDEVVNDPKVQKLPDHMFKTWVNLLCLASQNDGVLPSVDDLAFALRCNENTVTEALDFLAAADLLTVTKNQHSVTYSPHNWKKRQYKSDSSAERVKRHRDKKKAVTCNVTETPPETEQSRAETEAEESALFSEKELSQFRKQCPSLTDREFTNQVTNCELWINAHGSKTPELTLSKWLQKAEAEKPNKKPSNGLQAFQEIMEQGI